MRRSGIQSKRRFKIFSTIQQKERRLIPGSAEAVSKFTNSTIGKELGLQPTTEQKLEGKTPYEIYEIIYGGSKNYWEHPFFDKFREEEREYLDSLTSEVKVDEGILSCPNCGYKRISTKQKQIRSGDEPETAFHRCTKCNYQWRTN